VRQIGQAFPARVAASAEGAWLRVPAGARTLLHEKWLDGLVLLLALAALLDATLKESRDHPIFIPLSLLYAAPLLARRRLPLAAPALIAIGFLLSALADADAFNTLNLPFFCAIVATVFVGAFPDWRNAAVGGLVLIATVEYVNSRFPSIHTGDYVFILIVFGAAWLVGRALATRAQQAEELELRVREAERARADVALRAAAEERVRIAGELHDVVAHSVSVMVVQASGVRRLLTPEQHREREALLSVEQIGRQALSEMRRMLGVMRSGEQRPAAALAPQPGLEHLDRLIAQVQEAGLPVTLHIEGARPPLSPGIDLSAYRIVQEGLTNALKHAKGAHAEVTVRYAPEGLDLEVADDGPGVPNGQPTGHGLVGMRERVALYGGTLEAGPRPEGGFALRAHLPVEVAAP
jgi:signal transduction histidine kinase